jgi:hypothetical protein
MPSVCKGKQKTQQRKKHRKRWANDGSVCCKMLNTRKRCRKHRKMLHYKKKFKKIFKKMFKKKLKNF